MSIATRFSIAIHILTLLHINRENENTSEWMASSIGVHPVIVRNITGMLRRNGLVKTAQGVSGAQLSRPIDEITLLMIYRAVDATDELFAVHGNPNPACPVGAGIQQALESVFAEVQSEMEAHLGRITVARVAGAILTGKASAG